MNFTKSSPVDQVVKISATLSKDEYMPEFKAKLKDIKNKGTFKGFRKGKTPDSFIKKMYGKQTLSEIVNQKMLQGLYQYIQDEKLNIILDPLLSEDAPVLNFSMSDLTDYSSSFDVLLKPDFTVAGLDKVYDHKLIKVEEDVIDQEVEGIRKQLGQQVNVEEPIQSNDIVELSIYEVDEETGKPKNDGIEHTTKVYVEDLATEYKEALLGQKLSHTFKLDPYKLEKDKDAAFVNKYILNKESEEPFEAQFEAVVDAVLRRELAEMDQAFFDKYSGKEGEITTEEQMRDKIRDNIQKYYDEQTRNLLHRDILETVKEQTAIELPEAFVERWYVIVSQSEGKMPGDLKDVLADLRWALIRSELVKQHDIKVEQEDIRNAAINQARMYMRGYAGDDKMIAQMADYILNDDEQRQRMHNEVEATKVFEALENAVATNNQEISVEDFKTLVQSLQQS